ncbi:SIR2 family NAD-dependent protein deacylase [Paucibacter sp. DJ1R-11]|uniref:SIR2 family NAD-dependent protein deacylase n=1 Tax=Paucibacter sp. DJ1R-11 TaxID=2893556 RepID=UPI0021E3D6ED|nr:Sir2 family NAD-dependent protein deacetylase [Paucibacter sp. DJ1R-11]
MAEHHTLNSDDVRRGEVIAHALELLEQADALLVAAGAGMGVDSGLPDFRGREGFWQAYPALARAQLSFQHIANPLAFERQPRLAWGFYGHRLQLYRRTQPHAGFQILRRWGEQRPLGLAVFTSNVDGQFQKAGYEQEPVHECHGSIHHLQCLAGCGQPIWPAEDFEPEVDTEACLLINAAPVCRRCGGMARPNILMFGDGGWRDERSAEQGECLDAWLSRSRRPLVIEIGAGSDVPSVRHFSHRLIQQHRGRLLRINPREPRVPGPLDLGFAAGALAVLRELDAARN